MGGYENMDSSANLFQKNMTWRISLMHIKTKQNKTENSRLLAGHCHVKEENDYSLIWLDFILTSGHGLMILYRFSQFNVTWISGEFEKKHKSAMRNCTLSTFIPWDWQMILQCRFWFLCFCLFPIHWVYWESDHPYNHFSRFSP